MVRVGAENILHSHAQPKLYKYTKTLPLSHTQKSASTYLS